MLAAAVLVAECTASVVTASMQEVPCTTVRYITAAATTAATLLPLLTLLVLSLLLSPLLSLLLLLLLLRLT
jgi:hypothetical protein